MAKLSSAERKQLPAADFAGPGRSYPMPDRAHAANAKARASQAVKAGRMSESEKAHIDAKADRKLGFPTGAVAHNRMSAEMAHPGK